ncbi:hypothetical protein Dred_2996 [Desulforamulus reducens MI-1]|uniref:Uncharacterized protein n=1 Tax=Desulforamulus reducens (strain ATCC BAA-1160 / DSM 100696 / MI-1) TaxID=349161 RepID=A4J8U6_DESRM|nr:hypothetical protein [Desulforamulus reducens]ABO51499.1 hypothetical protein Dred_2996 [Desulforamulus reducens MI-1]
MTYYQKALKGTLVSDKGEQRTRLQKIEELKQKIVGEGYQPSEAEHFLKMAAGSRKIENLDNQELDKVIERLEAQITIAQKCKSMF